MSNQSIKLQNNGPSILWDPRQGCTIARNIIKTQNEATKMQMAVYTEEMPCSTPTTASLTQKQYAPLIEGMDCREQRCAVQARDKPRYHRGEEQTCTTTGACQVQGHKVKRSPFLAFLVRQQRRTDRRDLEFSY